MDVEADVNDEEQTQRVHELFEKICRDLSVDKKVADIAWRGYDAVRKQCTLEGDQMPWLACSVYVACWLCPPASVSDHGRKVPPLTIVESCQLSIIEFFEKLQKWVDMANMSRKFQDQVIKMESAFAVTSVIFKKFEPIFATIFVNPDVTASDAKSAGTRGKRGKRAVVTTEQPKPQQPSQYGYNELMEFCWILYIYAKRCFFGLGDDIMSSYHMLLCALDTVYTNVYNKRKDLLSPEFQVKQTLDDNSVIEALCKAFDGIVLDAKHMRIHWWRPKIKSFISDNLLVGDPDTLNGLLLPSNFEQNLQSLHERYEDAILKRGDMDERVFIPRHAGHALLTGSPSKRKRNDSESEGEDSLDYERELMLRRNVQACLERVNQYQAPGLSATRGFPLLSSEQFCPITPAVSQLASKLQALVSDCSLGPNPELKAMLHLIRPSPAELIINVVQNVTDAFVNACTQEAQGYVEGDEHFTEFANHSREVAEMLYYRILEKIIQTERERQPAADIGAVLNQAIFHKSLFACCTELVVFCYGSEKPFPWVLEIYDLPAYYFYKVIELVIRAENELCREMVKHLNEVEEKCLEEYVWVKNSPLWDVLSRTPMPAYEDIATVDGIEPFGPGYERSGYAAGRSRPPPAVARRRLDFEPGAPESPQAGHSGYDRQALRISSIQLPGSGGMNNTATTRAETGRLAKGGKQHSTNSLSLFFRKVYYLGSLRLSDLCERLRVGDSLKQHAWAMFDHVLRKSTESMRGRHLDQILMCSIYIIAKVSKQDVSFQDIMCSYRSQPQAKSRVYRNVLLEPKPSTPSYEMENREAGAGTASTREKLRSGSTLPIPAIGSAPPTPTPTEEEYGDLIKFYNQVFVAKMEDIAKKLSSSNENEADKESAVQLSPMPVLKSQSLSPRRRIADAVFVSPMKTGFMPHSPTRPLRYSFSRSPYKDLRAINNMLRAGSEHSPTKMMNYASYARRSMSGEGLHPGMTAQLRRFNT